MNKERLYVLWALPAGSNDPLDEYPLTSFPITSEQAEIVKKAAAKDGWHSFRLQKDDESPPDFTKAVQL